MHPRAENQLGTPSSATDGADWGRRAEVAGELNLDPSSIKVSCLVKGNGATLPEQPRGVGLWLRQWWERLVAQRWRHQRWAWVVSPRWSANGARASRWWPLRALRPVAARSRGLIAAPVVAGALGLLVSVPLAVPSANAALTMPRAPVVVPAAPPSQAIVPSAAALAPYDDAPAVLAEDPFADGLVVRGASIKGDGLGAVPRARTPSEVSSPGEADDFPGVKLDRKKIKGDGMGLIAPDVALTGGNGIRWNINTNVGFATSSSASGAMSEAGWPPGNPRPASTLNGGTINQTLGDAFDGYNGLAINPPANQQATTANSQIYNQNGPVTMRDCPGVNNPAIKRQLIFPPKMMAGGTLKVWRKVYAPDNDIYVRHINVISNTSGITQTVRLASSNNLGSDAGTRVYNTSDGDTTVEPTDTWVGTFQNFSGTTSSDPRLAHVLFRAGAVNPPSFVSFVNGDDNPFWQFNVTIPPNQTALFATFVIAAPTKAVAAAKAAELSNLTISQFVCLSFDEQRQIRNFAGPGPNLAVVHDLRGSSLPGWPVGGVSTLATIVLLGLAEFKRRHD